MEVNPIYDGPMYESPQGESFKQLEGSSMPGTPSIAKTSVGESSRYFDIAPCLPPPRNNGIKL